MKLGRKRIPETKEADVNGRIVSNGDPSNVVSNGNGRLKNKSDLAIYEQYQNQVISCHLLFACGISFA